jgi:hypothetical protein
MDIPLEDQEKRLEKEYDVNRSRMFKGTIAVSVVYGVIALIFVVLMFASERIKQILGMDLFAFSATFIVGVLVIVSILVYQILTFKKEEPSLPVDLYQCPDYWELTETPPDVINKFPEEDRPYVQYRCKPKDGIFSNKVIKTTTPASADNKKELQDAWTKFNTKLPTSANDQMSCQQIYPGWMAVEDRTVSKNNPTKMRCQYSAYCENTGAWTEVCGSVASV